MLTNIQVSSNHNENITLDKYTFELGYDDEFDMGKIAQMTPKDFYKYSFLGEFALDDESDAEMPGLKLKLDLRRIVSYFIVQVKKDPRQDAYQRTETKE